MKRRLASCWPQVDSLHQQAFDTAKCSTGVQDSDFDWQEWYAMARALRHEAPPLPKLAIKQENLEIA